MRNLMRLFAVAATVAFGAAPASARPAHDVSVRLRLSDIRTFGPVAKVRVVNRGTEPETGVVVRVFADHEGGTELWSRTVDLQPGKSARWSERIWFDGDATVLVATASLDASADEVPADNASRAGNWLRGGATRALVGREIHFRVCAACHGDDASGGSGPTIVGARAKAILAETAAGGDHGFPWLNPTDAKDLQRFLDDPAAHPAPVLPVAPAGGWPTFVGGTRTLFQVSCVSCHPAFGNYEPAARKARKLLGVVSRGVMPQGGPRWNETKVRTLSDWITGGRRP